MQLELIVMFAALIGSPIRSFADSPPVSQTISQSMQGAESEVSGPVSDVVQNTRSVFRQMGIVQVGVEKATSGLKETIKGQKGDLDVEVDLTETSPEVTHVGIVAKRGPVKWDKSFAKQVLANIVKRG